MSHTTELFHSKMAKVPIRICNIISGFATFVQFSLISFYQKTRAQG